MGDNMGSYIVMALGAGLMLWMIIRPPRAARYSAGRVIMAVGGNCAFLAGSSVAWPWATGLLTWISILLLVAVLVGLAVKILNAELRRLKVPPAAFSRTDEAWLRQIGISPDTQEG